MAQQATGNHYLEISILGLLSEDAMHGYELHRRILLSFASMIRPSWGSLYPALARLEANGCIRGDGSKRSAGIVPSTGSLDGELALLKMKGLQRGAGRARRVYFITDVGNLRLSEMLERLDIDDERSFWVGLSFIDKAAPNKRRSVIDKRRYFIEDRMAELKESSHFLASTPRGLALRGMYEKLSTELSWISSISEYSLGAEDSLGTQLAYQFGRSEGTSWER